MTTRCLPVTDGASIGKCDRLKQTSGLLLRTIIYCSHTYLLTNVGLSVKAFLQSQCSQMDKLAHKFLQVCRVEQRP